MESAQVKILAALIAITALPLALGFMSGWIDQDARDDFSGGFKRGMIYGFMGEAIIAMLIAAGLITVILWRV